jgi:predicted acetyltransferase
MRRRAVAVGPVESDADLAAFDPILVASLGFRPGKAGPWFERVGRGNLRVARRGREVVGGYALYPMGQWFGGRSVPASGIAAVAVSPHARGQGVGAAIVRDALSESRRRGLPLSSLYPATYPVYRAGGYESAGTRVRYRLSPAALRVEPSEATMRPLREEDRPLAVALHEARSRIGNGQLDRSPFLWDRVWWDPDDPVHGYLVEGGDGEPAGYVFFSKETGGPSRRPFRLDVSDAVATSEPAARRLLSFFATHASVVDSVALPAGDPDPLLMLAREEPWEVERLQRWMLRVVDVPAALSARGYSAAVEAELHLDVGDEVVPEGAGRLVLSVSEGRGTVRRGGRGALRLGVASLAPLYTGYLTAESLAAHGRVAGSPRDLALASLVFSGPAPWMADGF